MKVNLVLGIILAALLAVFSNYISGFIPYHLISAGVFALLIGMALNPLLAKWEMFNPGVNFVSKKILRLGIILMGATLSLTQVMQVGKFSFVVMTFTLITAFGGGYLLGKLFNMPWRLSSLISAGTGICGGSAIAAIAPAIDADDTQIAYAISATFIFDIIMVVLFPIMGRYFNMSDLGFGLWAGTAVNDTSSVVAAGYAFSDIAGKYAVIVKLTRTLSIVPIVLIFSFINAWSKRSVLVTEDGSTQDVSAERNSVDFSAIFPWFILMFIALVAVKSTGIISSDLSENISTVSKFMMVMALGAIGLKTNFKKLAKSGFYPMLHGFIISTLVVIAAFTVQKMIGLI